MFITTLTAAIAGGVTSAALATILHIPLRRRLGQLEMGLDEALPALITREEVGEAFTRLAIAEQQREQIQSQRLQHEQQMLRWLEVQRAQSAAAAAGPLFQTEAAPQAAAEASGFQPQTSQAQAAIGQMNEQLNRQLAQLNQRLQQVAAQQLPR